jgi:CheY-like chemotaxis protein
MKENGVIFLLENSTDYLFSLDQAFRGASLTNPIRVARYGNEAILYLKGVGIYHDRLHYPLPDVIVIDLSLPDGSALSVVGWIRRQPQFKNLPLVLLVHPTQQRLMNEVFSRDTNAYFVSRDDYDGLVQLLRDLNAMHHMLLSTPEDSASII